MVILRCLSYRAVIRCAAVRLHGNLHFLLLRSLIAAHLSRGTMAAASSTPSCDNEYSTRGGISAKLSLLIILSVCSCFNVSESVFGLMPLNSFIRSLNRSFRRLQRTLMMKSAHFLLITSIIPSMGQRHRWLHSSGTLVTSFVDSCYCAINFVV
jgi:hypothetical protein